MRLFASRARGPIGVTISARWIKAWQFQGRAGVSTRLQRRAAGVLTTAEAAALAGVFERAGFNGRHIVLVPPRDSCVMETLELPPRSSGAPLEQLARLELARTHRWEPSSFEVGLWELPSSGRADQSRVFAAALPFARSEPLLDACESAGLVVDAIDVPPNALARAYAPAAPDAMLDVGWSGAMLCVMHAGVVVYERTIEEAGLQRLVEPAARRLGIEPEAVETLLTRSDSPEAPLAGELRGPLTEYLDTLSTEVHRSLAYMAHRHASWQFRTLGMSGDGSALLGVRERLTTVLGIEAVNPTVPASHALAAGAARFGLGSARKEAA